MGVLRSVRTFARNRGAAVLAAALLAVSAAVWAPEPVFAATCTTLGNFEVDGDMTAATAGCSPTSQDWNTSGLGVQSTSTIGTYSASSKETNDPVGWTSAGGTPDKSDFATVYAFTRTLNGHFFAYVGWERTSGTGTGSYAIEIDNKPTRVANDGTPRPDRSGGGFVIYLSFQGATMPAFLKSCAFTSVATFPGTCSTSQNGYASAINGSDMTDPFTQIVWPAGQFFEAAIDFTQLTGIAPSCPAPNAASLYLRSITGNTLQNLKGYVKPFEVAPVSTCVPPPMSTTATPGNSTIDGLHGVVPGSSQHDEVTVGTGQVPGIGSVKFYLCAPATVTTNGGDCSSGGTLVTTTGLDNNGQASSDAVDGTTTPNDNATGTYCWRAVFTPGADDHTYTSGTHTNSTTECFTVLHASPTLTTAIAVTGDNAPGLGFTTLGDTATLHDFIGSVSGETVTFTLYGPYDNGVTPDCKAGKVVKTTSGTLSAGGVATAADTYVPTAAGTYVWTASYPGDLINAPASDSCNETAEKVTVVGATVGVAKSANPAGPVSAGDTIGFDLTVTNSGSVPALGVVMTDNLPAGGDLDWSLSPAYTGCAITGAVGAQTLTCNFTQLDGPGSLPVIHVASSTAAADCGVVSNHATITTTNGTGGNSAIATVTVNCPSLSLTKTADHNAPVSAGSQIGFTVTASNSGAAGTGTAKGVVVNDPLPGGSGVDWSIASGPANCAIQGSPPSETLHCTAVDLTAGASETVHVVSNTAFASCGVHYNLASLTATNSGGLSANATENVNCPNLSIAKTADAGTVDAGAQIGFTVTVGNNGASGTGTATGVAVFDSLPSGSGIDWSIASGPGNCSIQGTPPSEILVCTAVDLTPGTSESVHVVSDTSFASCKTYPNSASATSTNQATIGANASTTVLCPALTVTKTTPHPTVNAGDPIAFTVTVANSDASGTGTAHGVVIDDPLPGGSGVSWLIQSGPGTCTVQGTAPSQAVHCTAVDLAPGASESVTVGSGTTFASCATYSNVATVTASNHPSVQPNASTTVQCPAVPVDKTADAASVSAGEAIGFTVTVSNAGPGVATGATLADPLPAGSGVDWSVDTQTSDACDVTGAVGSQALVCGFGDLGAGASYTVHVTSATVFASCGSYQNTATVSADNMPDAVSPTASTQVLCPDLSFIKTADAESVDAGSPIGFTVTASNAGPGTAMGVAIADPLPSGVGVSWSIAGDAAGCVISGDVPNQVLDCGPVDLAPEQSIVVHVTSATAFVSCGTYDNIASLTYANGPAVQLIEVSAQALVSPATAEATTTVDCPALAIVKTADAATVAQGDPLGFTVHVTNGGVGVATSAVVDDPLPSGPGLSWRIDPAYAGPGTCTITTTGTAQLLHCALGDLAAGADLSVHVATDTDATSCGVYDNTATVSADNAPAQTATASTQLVCAQVLAEQQSAPPAAPLAATGTPVGPQLWIALGLLAFGGLFVLGGTAGVRRRSEG